MYYDLHLLEFGEIDAAESILFYNGDSYKFKRIGCFAWLLKGEETILIDTGFRDINVLNKTKKSPQKWSQKKDQDIHGNLIKYNTKPEEITKIIITHSHYDHISNISLFNNAKVYISRKEYEYLNNENNDMGEYLIESKNYLEFLLNSNRLILIDNGMHVNDKITIQCVGGHTPGTQIVIANTDIGVCMFTGDAIFLKDNVERNIPIGFTQNKIQSYEILKKCSSEE